MLKFVYPKLPSSGGVTTPFFRLSGNGLANCLFVYARSIIEAKKNNYQIITPTWLNLSLGPYLRQESDKRHYIGLFKSYGEIYGIKKLLLLLLCKRQIKVIDGLEKYFENLIDDAEYVSNYIVTHVSPHIVLKLDKYNFTDSVAIHVRLGDYAERYRTPIKWYITKIEEQRKLGHNHFLLFSDGTDDELKALISLPGVERIFLGSAIADILAISRCCYLIGSDSTFSGWGAFLGQIPCTFYRKHYGRVLKDASKETVELLDNLWNK